MHDIEKDGHMFLSHLILIEVFKNGNTLTIIPDYSKRELCSTVGSDHFRAVIFMLCTPSWNAFCVSLCVICLWNQTAKLCTFNADSRTQTTCKKETFDRFFFFFLFSSYSFTYWTMLAKSCWLATWSLIPVPNF